MSSEKSRRDLDRRGFLKAVGGGAAGVAGVAAAAIAPEPAKAAESATERKKRYKADSPHVQAFYRTNRY